MKKLYLFLLLTFFVVCVAASPTAAAPTALTACQPGTPLTTGSYVLANNLVADPGRDCLVIFGENITIDLAGFTIRGQPNPDAPGDPGNGITDGHNEYKWDNVVIRNGTITRFGQNGIDLRNTSSVKIEDVRVTANRLRGINVGPYSIVKDCIVFDNNQHSGVGIGVAGSSVVTSNIVTRNVEGIYADGPGNTIIGNTVNDNSDGISVQFAGNTVVNNTANNNKNYGIFADKGSTIVNNTADNNRIGIGVVCPNNLNANTAQFNTSKNYDISSGTGCKLTANQF